MNVLLHVLKVQSSNSIHRLLILPRHGVRRNASGANRSDRKCSTLYLGDDDSECGDCVSYIGRMIGECDIYAG